ncbi:MAG: sulfurtransferase-like selenium metabolism protein YedF [Peptoniphilaceae bacterium]|nr:sulfurtransferase-like selenium metabolism protein YedF [Peptoniphilaceae bacterium]MDY6018743.1 sulfurtransferase-like selenium metabolism protein YedF [Anaerococcus sp.]
MKEVDARGIECPMPVIMAKRLVNEGEEEFKVFVNEKIAVENLNKMAKQVNYKTSVREKENGEFELLFEKSESVDKDNPKKLMESEEYIVVFDSDSLGEGDKDFSKKLIESFLLALTEQDKYPEYLICYNRGVYLTTERENAIEDLKKLEDRGVKVLSCGLCLDNYGLKEKPKVGKVTNMYEIVGLMTSKRVVRP